jgi:hypothetical protein
MSSFTPKEDSDEFAAAKLLCGHWTFFRLGGDPNVTARCDLPVGHEGLHKFWHNPVMRETFQWSEKGERHEVRDACPSAATTLREHIEEAPLPGDGLPIYERPELAQAEQFDFAERLGGNRPLDLHRYRWWRKPPFVSWRAWLVGAEWRRVRGT